MIPPRIEGPLFGPVYPTGPVVQQPDTSRAAGETVAPTLRDRQRAVLVALDRRGDAGATADELCVDLGLTRNSVAPRLTELSHLGTVRDSGLRRKTPTGSSAAVYVVARTR